MSLQVKLIHNYMLNMFSEEFIPKDEKSRIPFESLVRNDIENILLVTIPKGSILFFEYNPYTSLAGSLKYSRFVLCRFLDFHSADINHPTSKRGIMEDSIRYTLDPELETMFANVVPKHPLQYHISYILETSLARQAKRNQAILST